MDHAVLGPGFSAAEIRHAVDRGYGSGEDVADPESSTKTLASRHRAPHRRRQNLGWFQGAAEWGPRALGNRSILADPRRPEMKDILNRRIKHRETFRPFAPSILEEATGEFFEKTHPSPFMTFAYSVRPEKRGVIPAPTHVDGTARLQTVSRTANPLYWKLIRAFGDLTGVPVVLNTSFNDNEPIVCRPEEALDCFLRTQMDVLVMGNFVLEKKSAAIAQSPRTSQRKRRASPAPNDIERRIEQRGRNAELMHILLLNEYYPPDTSATAKMAAQVAETLAQQHQVTVVAGRPSYDPDEYYPYRASAPRHAQQRHRRVRGLHRVSAPPDASPRLELSFVSRAGRSARSGSASGRGSGHDRSSRRGNRRRLRRAAGGTPFVYNIRDMYPGHGRRRRYRAAQRDGCERWEKMHRRALESGRPRNRSR